MNLDDFNPIEVYWYTPTNHKYKRGNNMNDITKELVQKWDGKDGTERATLERVLTPDEIKARQEKKAKYDAERKAAAEAQDGSAA